MRRALVGAITLLAASLGACTTFDIDMRSARIAYESADEWGHRPDRPEVILRIDFTTTFDLTQNWEAMGFLVPCGALRGHLGGPVGNIGGLTYIMLPDKAQKSAGHVFTARFSRGSYEEFFSVTSPEIPPADGIWQVRFNEGVEARGLCFYVRSGGTLLNSPTSADMRIDNVLAAASAPHQTEAMKE